MFRSVICGMYLASTKFGGVLFVLLGAAMIGLPFLIE